MKRITLTLMASLFAIVALAQNDKLVKHSGETLEVKIIKVAETTITYKYPGEDAEEVIGKPAVAYILHGQSGRKEEISEKVTIAGKDDWEKVQILTDPSQILGLKKGEDIRGKTAGYYSFHSAGSADKKATKKIKEAAAELGAPFILLVSEKGENFRVNQSVKNGVTYSYK